ncbi:MAG: ATP-binding protein [Bdellovibrionota bacterium]
MDLPRKLALAVQKGMEEFPVVTITGPRQSGKTTLIKTQFPNFKYINLEEPKVQDFARMDPSSFLRQFPDGVILDEVQRVPELLSYIQVIVDEKKRNGQFILSGSHQFTMMRSINQSLAGRTAVFHLLPFSLSELQQSNLLIPKNLDINEFLIKGFYPRIYSSKTSSDFFYSSYFETYVERDVRELIMIKDLSLFKKFITLCAGRVGQILNKDSLARDVGISAKTVEEWLSVLEASFIIFRLQPYFENIGKRLIKSPKLYFYDVGLVCFLLGIENEKHVTTHPLRGNIFENMQVSEAIKWRFNQGKQHRFYFYRDTKDNEIDLIFSYGGKLYPIEIKSAETFRDEFLKGIRSVKDYIQLERPFVVYGGVEKQVRTEFDLVPWYGLEESLEEIC